MITDHKPLLGLLDGQKPTSPQASARIRWWSLYLSLFEYTLKLRNTTAHANDDALSRLPLPMEPAILQLPPELVSLVDHLANSPVTAHQIHDCTRKDPQLAPVVQFVQQGWPDACPDPDQLSPFFEKRTELSLYKGCLLWGTRVIIPTSCQDAVLTELHGGHPRVTRMKASLECTCGGLESQRTLNALSDAILSVSCTSPHYQLLHCIRGVGLLGPRLAYISTTLVLYRER